MKSGFPRNCCHAIVSLVIVMVAVMGCASLPPASSQKMVRANSVLTTVGKFAEDSFYACMLNGYLQGLPLAQLEEECATKLLEDDKKGFGAGPLGEITASRQDFFKPANISAACGHGIEPTRSQSSGYGSVPVYGRYTYGGDPNKYYGLKQEESKRQKNENIAYAENAIEKFDKAFSEATKKEEELRIAKEKGDAAAIKKAEEELEAAAKAVVEQANLALLAIEKANEDPNKKPQPVGRSVAGESTCEQALQAAQELLRECHRTHWKDFRCQQLWASMSWNCPDPALILVDPEQGYTCGVNLDAEMKEALRKAWVARCEQRVKPGPDGANPCQPPSLDASGRYLKGDMSHGCNDPHAYITPDSERCSARFNINKKPLGQPDIHQIIVLGINKLGGPIFVIPTNPKPPRPGGPDPPRPGGPDPPRAN